MPSHLIPSDVIPDLTEVRHLSERAVQLAHPRRSFLGRPTPWRIVRNVGLALWFGGSVLEARTPHDQSTARSGTAGANGSGDGADSEKPSGREPSPDRRDRKKAMHREAHAEEVLADYQHRVQRTWTPVVAAGAVLTVVGGAGVLATGGRYSQAPPVPIALIASVALGATVVATVLRERSLMMWEQRIAGESDEALPRGAEVALRVTEPLVPVMTGSLLVAATVDG